MVFLPYARDGVSKSEYLNQQRARLGALQVQIFGNDPFLYMVKLGSF